MTMRQISRKVQPQKKHQLQGNLSVTIFREGKSYVAYSPALDLSTAAKSLPEVQARFGELAGIFFKELIERGTLDEVLLDLGWDKTAQGFSPPVVVAHEEFGLEYATNHTHSLAQV